MSRWIFLDVGNILLDEDPLALEVFRIHWAAVRSARPDTAFLDLLAERARHAARGSRWPLYDAVSAVLDEPACARAWDAADRSVRARFDTFSPLIDGAQALVESLAAHFRLGLIANQGPECRAWLDQLGLLAAFEIVVFGEEHGLAKPDPRLFRLALDVAAAPADRCLMVGDRLDNDIAPAAAAGMATLWVRWPNRADKGWRPREPEALAFRDSLERAAAATAAALATRVTPTAAVDRIDEIAPIALRWSTGAPISRPR